MPAQHVDVDRRAIHATLLVFAVVKVMVVATLAISNPTIIMLVWNSIALIHLGRPARIPRAIAAPRRRWWWRAPWTRLDILREPAPDPHVGRWRPLEPFVLDARPWT